MTFETWFNNLISDQRWFELLRAYKDSTIKAAAEKVFAQLVADKTVDIRPMSENRKHVYNILCKNPGDKPKKHWWELQKEEEKKNEPEWRPASPEHVDKCVAEFDEMMKNAPMNNAFPRVGYKQSVEKGGWLPKKEAPYPITSPMEVYIRERHIDYIKTCYDARTAQKLPTWIEENEFNLMYDEENKELLQTLSKKKLSNI